MLQIVSAGRRRKFCVTPPSNLQRNDLHGVEISIQRWINQNRPLKGFCRNTTESSTHSDSLSLSHQLATLLTNYQTMHNQVIQCDLLGSIFLCVCIYVDIIYIYKLYDDFIYINNQFSDTSARLLFQIYSKPFGCQSILYNAYMYGLG